MQDLRGALIRVVSSKGQPSQDSPVGMAARPKQEYDQDYGCEVALMNGSIVDLECWPCSSAIPLAKGLLSIPENTPTESNKINTFERFT